MQRSMIKPVAALLALVATIALIPQCSPAVSCCRTENTAVISHPCCRAPEFNRAMPQPPSIVATAVSVNVMPLPVRIVAESVTRSCASNLVDPIKTVQLRI